MFDHPGKKTSRAVTENCKNVEETEYFEGHYKPCFFTVSFKNLSTICFDHILHTLLHSFLKV